MSNTTVNPSDALEIVVVAVGIVLLLKRVVDMDTHHNARVVALTLILSVGVVFLFYSLGDGIGNDGLSNCVIEFNDGQPSPQSPNLPLGYSQNRPRYVMGAPQAGWIRARLRRTHPLPRTVLTVSKCDVRLLKQN